MPSTRGRTRGRRVPRRTKKSRRALGRSRTIMGLAVAALPPGCKPRAQGLMHSHRFEKSRRDKASVRMKTQSS